MHSTSRSVPGMAGCAGAAVRGSQGCGVGQAYSFPPPALQLWHPPWFGAGVPLAEGGWFLSSPALWDGPVTWGRVVQSGAGAGDAPGHCQGWALSLGTFLPSPCGRAEHLAELWCQGRAVSTAQAGWRQGAAEAAWGPGAEQAGQPTCLSQSSCCALDVPHPQGLGSLFPPEQHPGPYPLGQGGCDPLVPAGHQLWVAFWEGGGFVFKQGGKKK